MPTWKDAQGKTHHLAPYYLTGSEAVTRGGVYLDCGPLFLVFSGLIDADDELMRSTLAWFREGPPAKLYRHEADFFQLASLHREMSSCEPCYSWNVFHSWQLGDRYRFLEGMYSQFAGAMSRETYSVCETRGGIMATTHWLPVVLLARLAVVDDQITEDELHLLRLVPLAWLRSDRELRIENAPTEFGPINIRAKLANGGKELQITFSDRFRSDPKNIVLHVPPVKGLSTITLNARPLKWDGKEKTLVIERI
ncbi:MAG: hypothetical protein HYX78_12740 [Armatimonadetes bacterium]|nr:hypothetical protein [Armatimonadota bacterium]